MGNTKPFIRRTIIASAVAAIAGGAFAATAPAADNSPWESAPEGLAAQTGTIEWSAVKDENLFKLASGTYALLSVQDEKTFTGKLWVVGSGKDTQASGIWASGGEAKAVNAGSIYVTAEGDGKSWSQHALSAANGAEAVNEGTIVARNAYGMTIGSDKNGNAAATIRNNGVIYVETQGAAMELGGVSGSTAINAGRIEAGKPADEAINEKKFTHGVLINTAGNTFTNKGVIDAADASSAIEVNDKGCNTTINLEAGSTVVGVVHIDEDISGTVLNANGFKGTIDLDNDSAEDNALTINVKDGADLTLADGFSNKISKVEITDGTFTTSIWQTASVDAEADEAAFDNALKSVTVNAGGVFNVKALNSGGKTKDEPTKPHDTLLFMGTDVVLNGGALQVDGANYTGSIKVGTASAAGSLDIKSGSYSYESLYVAKKGTVNVGGALAVGTLALSDGKKNNAAKLTVAEGGSIDVSKSLSVGGGESKMIVNGTLSLAETAKFDVAAKGALTVSDGTLEIWNGQAFSESKLSTSLANTKFENKAFVEIQNDVAMTTEELKDAQKLFEGTGANLSYANLELKLTDAEKENGVAFDTSFGTAMIGQTVTTEKPGADGKATAEVGNATVGVGTIRVAEGTKTLTLTGENGTTYFSGSAELFEGATLEAVEIEGAAILGQTAEASGVVNVKDFKAKDLTVVGRYSAQNVTTDNAASIEGVFKVQSINGAGATVAENGVLDVSLVNADVKVNDGGLFVLGEPVPAAAAPALLRATDAAPAPQKTAQINKAVTIASGGAFAFDEAAGRALLARINDGAYGDNIKSGFLVDASVTVGESGKVQIGDATLSKTNAIAAGKDVVTIVDASKFGEKDVVFDAATVKLSGKNLLENASRAQTLILTSGEFEGEKFALANAFLEGTTTKKEQVGTLLTVGLKANDSLKTDAATYGALESIVNSTKAGKLQQLVGAIGESAEAGFFNEEGALTAQGAQAVTEAATLPVTAGLYNAAYDAAREVTGAVERRHLTPSTGLGLWADVFYAKNEAKSLYGANGYSGSVTGGTLGVDGEMPCGAKAGVALSVGTADADSEKTIGRYSTDSDFWGVTLYAGRDIGGLAFSADVSYLAFENDLQGAVAGASVKESVDATVFTAGLRADMTVWESAGKGFAVVPHAGLRYTKIDADDAFGFKSDSLDVFEAPIGVKVAGRFEPTAGWQVSPSFDFTAVPQLGDKTVGTIAGDVNVLDNVYNATLGVSAAKDAFTFGLSYRYGFGTDDRADQVIQARVGYAF